MEWTKEYPRRAGSYFLRWPNGLQEIVQCVVTTPAIMGEFNGQDYCVADGVMSVFRIAVKYSEPESMFQGGEWLGPITPEQAEQFDALRKAADDALTYLESVAWGDCKTNCKCARCALRRALGSEKKGLPG